MRIRGAIYDACRKEDILPRNQRDKLDGLEKVTQRLEQTLGRLPSEQEVAKAAGLETNDYYQVLDSLFNVLPIDDIPENLLPTDLSADPLEKFSSKQCLCGGERALFGCQSGFAQGPGPVSDRFAVG